MNRPSSWGGKRHVIACGLGGVGLRTVEHLHQSGVPVVVLDDDPDLRLAGLGPYEELLLVLQRDQEANASSPAGGPETEGASCRSAE